MKRLVVEDTPFAGLKRVRRHRLGDSRGFLARLFCADELAEAIPPAYTEFIGRQLLRACDARSKDDRESGVG